TSSLTWGPGSTSDAGLMVGLPRSARWVATASSCPSDSSLASRKWLVPTLATTGAGARCTIVLLESLRILGSRTSIPSSRARPRATSVAKRLRSSPSTVLIQPISVQALGRAQAHLQLDRKHLGEAEEGGQPHVALDEDEEVRPSDVANGDQARERRTVP